MPRICLLLVLGVVGCGPDATPPPTDYCAVPSSGNVASVEIGAANSEDLFGHPSVFMPLHDGDGVSLVRGGQGAMMLGLLLRVSGAPAPTCLDQQTMVADTAGARITTKNVPVTTYEQPDGTRVTHGLWLPGDYPSTFVVTVAAGGQSQTLHLHLQLTK